MKRELHMTTLKPTNTLDIGMNTYLGDIWDPAAFKGTASCLGVFCQQMLKFCQLHGPIHRDTALQLIGIKKQYPLVILGP